MDTGTQRTRRLTARYSLLAAVTIVAGAGGAPAVGVPSASPAASARAFSEYKFAGPAPLPLREAREDWPALRARAASDPAVARWIAGIRGNLDSWMTQDPDNAAWNGGWGHDYADPTTGRPLAWKRTDAEPPASATKVHGAWVFFRRTNNILMAQNAARLWKLTGDTRYRDWAAAQLDFYAANYTRWPVKQLNGYSQMMGQSLDEATSGIVLADTARLLDDAAPPARRQQWRQGLFEPLLANIVRSNRGANNIAVWQSVAAAIVATEAGDKAAVGQALDGPDGIRALLRKGVLPDYSWFEPSFGYANYTARALSTLFAAASLSGHAGALVPERLLTQDMIASLLAVRFADGSIPAPGDTEAKLRAVDPGLLQLSQRTMPLRVGALPLSWDTLLDPQTPAALPPETQTRVWDAGRFAMLRTGGTELFAHWGQPTPSHWEQDAPSWELHLGGATVTSSAGSASYGSKLYLTYLRKSAAHNMPMIDGAGQVTTGLGTVLDKEPTKLVVRASGFAPGATVERAFQIGAAAAGTVTTIRTSDGAPHRLGEVFNTSCTVKPDAPLMPTPAPTGDGFSWWQGTRASAPSPQWTATLGCGGTPIRLTWHADQPGRVYVSRAPDATGAPTRTALYFEANAPALTTTLRLAGR